GCSVFSTERRIQNPNFILLETMTTISSLHSCYFFSFVGIRKQDTITLKSKNKNAGNSL
ncbi:MAG: hypothetical protein ACI8VT_004438, partial [Saprospiraceae bacterium]